MNTDKGVEETLNENKSEEKENSYFVINMTFADVLKKSGITRSEGLKSYANKDKIYKNNIGAMEDVMGYLEKKALEIPKKAPAIFKYLQLWFPDLFSGVVLKTTNQKKERVALVKKQINESGFSLDD